MRILGILSFFCAVLFAESFISDYEYGQMLFKNPRGIGCNKCHGENGEGSLIATYKDFNKTSQTYYERQLIAPAIDKISLQEFADGITNSKSVMPSYFLTQDVIIILYKYIKKIGIKDEK